MKFTLAVVAAAAFAVPAFAMGETTTVTAPPCPSTTASVNDIVTRSPVAAASAGTPCPTFSTIKASGAAMTPGAMNPMGTPMATPTQYTGAANKASAGGALLVAAGFAAYIL
ncbi:hypothetical protein K490DRAFT_61592 [Saccharata proteae CBS 121410]|uniref:Uncharacterized protein n=1 Tax=Saccharata proteae CBS 121410 TaxID=1314787 RepID=A0A9P4I3N9_9PEZI|nr:hypothetical protein K490DRAFT_61592 [Saccharata proteae CBS 121410]